MSDTNSPPRDEFERQRTRASDLREGLFNASAVVESRLSTRLSQNVRLLTYVSIFYLPLAFCAALWAVPNITESSTRSPFILASLVVGLLTYFIVFNLDSVVSFGWRMYSGFRNACVEQMVADSKDFPQRNAWRARARGFSRFEPDRGRTKPSEWYILLFFLMTLFGRRIKPGKVEKDEDGSSSRRSVSASSVGSSSADISAEGAVSEDLAAEPMRGKEMWKRWIRALFIGPGNGTEKDGASGA